MKALVRRAGPLGLSVAVSLALGAPGTAATAAARPQAAAAAFGATDLIAGLHDLDALVTGRSALSAAQRADVHEAKAALIAKAYTQSASGVRLADVLTGLDCVDTDLQKARNSHRRSTQGSAAARAAACQRTLARRLKGTSAAGDAKTLGKRIAAVAAAIRSGRAFGAKATAIRRSAARLVGAHFRVNVDGVPVSEHFRDLECVDVKVEAGRISGASSCVKRLARMLTEQLVAGPAPASITWGSNLAGSPVSIDGTWREDTEFWNQGVTAPVDGTVTAFRLRVGDDPTDLPVRFSIVRPQPGGSVVVITTTDPPLVVPAHSPGVHSLANTDIGFRCCAVKKGDIVTVDNSGANTVSDPFHWFARKASATTLSHMAAGVGQGAGTSWTGTPHPGYETLLQVVEQPGR